jgi:hypothetical protein
MVLAGRLGQDGLTQQMQYDVDHGETQLAPDGAPRGTMAVDVKSLSDIRSAAWIEPVAGESLTFRTVGSSNPTTVVPLSRIFGERYGVYWKVSRPRWWQS